MYIKALKCSVNVLCVALKFKIYCRQRLSLKVEFGIRIYRNSKNVIKLFVFGCQSVWICCRVHGSMAVVHAYPSWWLPASLCLQLRVIRAFKSTLEDLEERRSIHSLHSLHSLRSSRSHTGPWPPRPLSDITYIDEDPTSTKLSPQQQSKTNDNDDHHRLLSPNTLRLPQYYQPYSHHNNPPSTVASKAAANNTELPKPVHETRI